MATYNIPTLAEVMAMDDADLTVVDLENPSEANPWTGTYADEAVLGMDGNDTLRGDGGSGQDSDEASHDFINGNKGDDEIYGGQGNDTLRGGQGDDTVEGGAGDDVIGGDDGNDTLMGDGGDDLIQGNLGHDRILGGGGDDTLIGGMGHDYLDGGDGDDMIVGDVGNDHLSGGKGDDTLYGRKDNDSIMAGDGDDSVNGNQGMDTIDGGDGADMLRGGRDDDSIDGGDGHDMIHGDRGGDILRGEGGADTIYGDNDESSPDHAGDMIVGGMEKNWGEITDYHLDLVEDMKGNKIVYGDVLEGGVGNDTIYAGTSTTGGDGSQSETVTFEYPSGGQSAKITFIHGNMLDGGAGNDMLYGAEGQDTLVGGAGNDSLVGNGQADKLMGGTGNDTLTDGEGVGGNMLMGDGGNDMLTGAFRDVSGVDNTTDNTENDSVAADVLNGGSGNDTLKAATDAIAGTVTANDQRDTDNDGSPDDLTVVTADKAGLVMIGGSGNDVFDFSTALTGAEATFRTHIEIRDFSIGSDKVYLADQSIVDALHTSLDPTSTSGLTAGTAGSFQEVGDDTFIAIDASNVVLKFVGISAAELDGVDQVFFAAPA